MAIAALWPTSGALEGPGAADQPGRSQEQNRAQAQKDWPGKEALMAGHESGNQLLQEEALGELAQGKHESTDAGIVFDLKAEVGVHVHFGEEVGV